MSLKKRLTTGFTIVEMLIYMGLMSILLVLLSSMFVSILETQAESVSDTSLVSESQYITAKIRYDINRTNVINTPAAEGITTNMLSLSTDAGEVQYAINGSNILTVTQAGISHALHTDELETTSLAVVLYGNDTGVPSIEVEFVLKDVYTEEERSFSVASGLR